jgi:hypothetical protein
MKDFSKMVSVQERESIILVMEDLGKDNGFIIYKMDMDFILIMMAQSVGEHGKWDKKSVNKKINNYQNKHSKTE